MKYDLFLILFFSLGLPAVSAQTPKKVIASVRIKKATDVFSNFSALGADSLPAELLKKAKAVAIFGEILKNRSFPFTLGTHITGSGLISFRRDSDWSVPTFLTCGGTETELNLNPFEKKKLSAVFLFINDKSVEAIKNGDTRSQKMNGQELALGPVIKGKGAEITIENAAILYYTFDENKLSGEELKNSVLSYSFYIKHDNNLNKTIFGKKFKALLAENPSSFNDPEIEAFRSLIAANAKN